MHDACDRNPRPPFVGCGGLLEVDLTQQLMYVVLVINRGKLQSHHNNKRNSNTIIYD